MAKHALTRGAITALLNAAKRANTPAGWKSARPFLAMSSDAVAFLDGEDNEEFVTTELVDTLELESA